MGKIKSKRNIEKYAKISLTFMFTFLFILILNTNYLSATTGCCYDSSSGLCSMNADQNTCTSTNGTFYSSTSCSVSQCDLGCCVLGSATQHVTSRTCQVLSVTYGFSYPSSFDAGVDALTCTGIANGQQYGACLGAGTYDRTCSYTTQTKCTTGDFRSGLLCSAPELNTICNKSTNTLLVSGTDQVYYEDTCGNQANIYDSSKYNTADYWRYVYNKSQSCGYGSANINSKTCGNCDFNLGSLGATYDSTTGKPTYGNYICKNLNCQSGKNNGDSWCVDVEGLGNVLSSTGGTTSGISTNALVGSRYYRQYCLNSNVYTEPCADFRVESCQVGTGNNSGSTCENNPWNTCLEAGNNSAACDLTSCYMYDPAKAHCVTSPTGTTGYCTKGDDTSSWYPSTINGESFTLDSSSSSSSLSKEDIMSQYPDYSYGGKTNSFLASLHLEKCVPLIAGGLNFYSSSSSNTSSSSSTSSTSTSTASTTCAAGNYKATIKFLSWDGEMHLSVSSADDFWGNAAILDATESQWGDIETDPYHRECKNGNPYCGSEHNPKLYINEYIGPQNIYVPISQAIGDALIARCQAIADCNGKANWIGKEGTDVGFGFFDETGGVLSGTSTSTGSSSTSTNVTTSSTGSTNSCTYDYQLEQWCCGHNCFSEKNDCLSKSGCTTSSGTSSSSAGIPVAGVTNNISSSYFIPCAFTAAGNGDVDCNIDFTCAKFSAAYGDSDCGECGKDGLACSEYRCKALGKSCDYFEPNGVGYCKSSSDHSPPVITCTSPSGCPSNIADVKPYKSVDFTITTDEDSQCKFNLNSAGSSYSTMTYDFGTQDYSTTHTLSLNLPGQSASLSLNGSNASIYSLITTDGKYNLYVRCIDVAGNGETMSPYIISFNVMQTPDTNAPIILNITPISGSPIAYNTSSKSVTINLNEPSQCRWSSTDQDYDLMKNNFSCDLSVSNEGILNGYYVCSGILTNISMNTSSQTTFYIRCKDQPWMTSESITTNGVTYSRNKNLNSETYILKASEPFYISSMSPSGTITKSILNSTVDISAQTAGGGFSGVAECSWRLSNDSSFSNSYLLLYSDTNSNLHTQSLTQLTEGFYYYEAQCTDNAGNFANKTTSFNFVIDKTAPIVNRFYYYMNNLKLRTTENAICYFSTSSSLNCFYDIANGTMMTGYATEHTATWQDDKTLYIKCKDYYDNLNSGCGVVVRTY